MISPSNKIEKDPILAEIIQYDHKELLPIISLNGADYSLNTIDIVEGFAKFEEAVFAQMLYDIPLEQTIDPDRLSCEYYAALEYFVRELGKDRVLEFPTACEAALMACHLPRHTDVDNWKNNHIAWRFIKIVHNMKKLKPYKYTNIFQMRKRYRSYLNSILKKCGFESVEKSWKGAITYVKKSTLNIPSDMMRAIKFIKSKPLALSYCLIDAKSFSKICKFRPYSYITLDGSGFTTSSKVMENELIFENHYQALAHQICGQTSKRYIYPMMLQCGFSYYGVTGCPYLKNGSCDGHIDATSELPKIKLDQNKNIIEGCTFECVMNIMGFSFKDLIISDMSKNNINIEALKNNAQKLKDVKKEPET